MKITACLRALLGVFALTFISHGSQAAPNVAEPAAHVDPACRQNEADPFDQGWRISPESISEANRCLDTRRLRALRIVSRTDQEIVFANFRHQGKYWIARWDRTDAPKASAWTLFFPVNVPLARVAHEQARFEFTKGLQLTDHISGEAGPTVNDVIISWETVFPENQSFGIVSTLRSNFPIIGRALSTEMTIEENTPAPGQIRRSTVSPLLLTAAQGSEFFERSLVKANSQQYDTYYRLLWVNCASQMFSILDEVLNESSPDLMKTIQKFSVSWSADPVAGPVLRALRSRRIVDASAAPLEVNKIFGLEIAP